MMFKKIEDERNIDEISQYTIFDETFSILSHEINNPLSSIKVNANYDKNQKILIKNF